MFMSTYVDLKVMSATEKVLDALKARGFFVKEENGAIVVTCESAREDLKQITFILNKLNIPFILQENKKAVEARDYWGLNVEDKKQPLGVIEILVNSLPNRIYQQIFRFGGQPFIVDFQQHRTHWRYFTSQSFGPRIDALSLEYNMARFVKVLNLSGIAVLSGCNGHLKYSPRVEFSSEYYGAWFEVIQELYLKDLKLNYEWHVLFEGRTGSELRAISSDEKWNLNKIHQDLLKIADVIEEHSATIRKLKDSTFSKHSIEPKEFVQQGNFRELINWMNQQI